MEATEFWDKMFAQGKAGNYSRVEMPDLNDPILQAALKHFGSVKDKTVIDLGCGRGATSLFFASQGAKVISVDLSKIAIANLSAYCQENNIQNITPLNMGAHELTTLGKADFIFGAMILHHIEPFNDFVKIMREVLATDGKGFFWENNARSCIMIWFRQNIVGKLWVPKYGDEEEFPLMLSEVDEIRKDFNVEVEYPELMLFRMISSYLLRGRAKAPFQLLDNYFFRYPAIRKYSYRQYLYLS